MAVRTLPVGDEKRILRLLVRDANGLCGIELVERDPKIHDHGVYETLDRMRERGLVLGDWEKRPGTRGRGVKVFKVTAFGARTWQAMLAADAVFADKDIASDQWVGGTAVQGT